MATATITACNPKLYAPQIDEPKEYIFGRAFNRDTTNISQEWWQMFGDTTLNRLVERAMSRNKDLLVAASRIEEARNNLKVVRSAYLPSIDLGIEAGVSYSSNGKTYTQTYGIAPTFSWEIPLFGSLRHASNAARASIMYEEWQYRGVRLSLAAEVAITYFTLLQYKQDLSIAQRSAELRGEMAALIDSMAYYGFASGVNLEQARSLLATARADVPRYERAIRETTLSLGVLLGDTPSLLDSLGNASALMSDYRPYDIPVGTPSDILHRRPDIMQAYYTMRQNAAEVGVARSARFPSFVLPRTMGTGSNSIEELFSSRSWVGSMMLTITQPLLNFGGLKRKEMAAREQYNQSLLAYEKCYLQALAEVEQSMVAISTYRSQIVRYAEYVTANMRISDMNKQLYMSGLSDYLNVIDAERELYTSQMQFANLVAQQYINYINLCKALGGGWERLDEKSFIKGRKK